MGQRQEKIGQLIQAELSGIFQKRKSDFSAIVTVTHVIMSADLNYAKVYVTAFPDSEKPGVIESLKNQNREIRKLLSARIRHQMRVMPELSFHPDDSYAHAARIEEVFRKIEEERKKKLS